jgi:methylated-DNA-[protein]-cysteine S-methyltransferase
MAVVGLFMDGHSPGPALGKGARQDRSPLRTAREQVEEFLAGQRRVFNLRFEMEGTPFQKRVWGELLAIPYGGTRTYGWVAANIGCPLAARAVGAANRSNPLSLIVPCHRVLAASGAISGYGGGVERKRFLLNLESQNSLLDWHPPMTRRRRG